MTASTIFLAIRATVPPAPAPRTSTVSPPFADNDTRAPIDIVFAATNTMRPPPRTAVVCAGVVPPGAPPSNAALSAVILRACCVCGGVRLN